MSAPHTIAEHRAARAAGRLDVAEYLCERLARLHAAGPDPAWIHLAAQANLESRLAALERLDPDECPLYGVPFAVKDNIDVAGWPTTAACPEFAYSAQRNANVVKLLLDAGARLRTAASTAPCYRLYALAGGPPARPGLVRVSQGTRGGAAITVEVWDVPAEAVGPFLAGIPEPLGLGSVELEDGSRVTGFPCETYALEGAEEVTGYGGWRRYLEAAAHQWA